MAARNLRRVQRVEFSISTSGSCRRKAYREEMLRAGRLSVKIYYRRPNCDDPEVLGFFKVDLRLRIKRGRSLRSSAAVRFRSLRNFCLISF